MSRGALGGQHALAWAGFKATQPWSMFQRQEVRRWEETFRSQAVRAGALSPVLPLGLALLSRVCKNLWKTSGDQKASEIIPQMWWFCGSPVKALACAWGTVTAGWAEHGKQLPEEIKRLETVWSRHMADCFLSHSASTAMMTLKSICAATGGAWAEVFPFYCVSPASCLGWWPFWKEGHWDWRRRNWHWGAWRSTEILRRPSPSLGQGRKWSCWEKG